MNPSKPAPKRKRTPAKRPVRKRTSKPVAVGDILGQLIQASPLGETLEQARIWEFWPEIAGPQLAAHGRPHSVQDRTLYIEVDSAVWMHRYSYKKFAIIRSINRMARKELVSDLFLRLLEDGKSLDSG